eukprot:COSAG01_NODE_240_length_20656_cov_53.398259_22_plen_81_part_00
MAGSSRHHGRQDGSLGLTIGGWGVNRQSTLPLPFGLWPLLAPIYIHVIRRSNAEHCKIILFKLLILVLSGTSAGAPDDKA